MDHSKSHLGESSSALFKRSSENFDTDTEGAGSKDRAAHYSAPPIDNPSDTKDTDTNRQLKRQQRKSLLQGNPRRNEIIIGLGAGLLAAMIYGITRIVKHFRRAH